MLLIPVTMFMENPPHDYVVTYDPNGGDPIATAKPERITGTFDADKVSLYMPAPDGCTRLVFDNGYRMLIEYDYDKLMLFLAEHDDAAPKPSP